MHNKLWSTGLRLGSRHFNTTKAFWKGNTIRFTYAQSPNHPTIQKILEGGDLTNIDEVLTEIKGLNTKNR